VVLRIINSQAGASLIAKRLKEMVRAGVSEIIVDTQWEPVDAAEVQAELRAAAP
jgi:hypothetical protein